MVCWEYRHIGPSIQQAGAELFVWFRLYFCFLCLTSLGFEFGCFGLHAGYSSYGLVDLL